MNNEILKLVYESCLLHSDEVFFIDPVHDTKYTFKKFLNDVQKNSAKITREFPSKQCIVIGEENSYRFAVLITASWFAHKTVYLQNPNEDERIKCHLLSLIPDHAHIDLSFFEDGAYSDNYPPSPFPENQDFTYIPTSATTGTSKIVRQSARCVLENVQAVIKHHHLNDRKRIIGTPLPLFHVNALYFSFFASLLTGGTIVLFSQFDLKLILHSLARYNVEILSVIPTILNSIARSGEIAQNYDLSSLNYFVSAAAPLSSNTVKQIWLLTGKKIIQGYGLSEGINFSCKIPVNISDELYERLLINSPYPSIGPPLSGTTVKIMCDQELCPEGKEGELFIKGTNFQQGYLQTEIVLSDDFFPTGDLGYYQKVDNENYFFITGRKKEMAKINGESVSLRMIEDLIRDKLPDNREFIICSFDNDYRGEEMAVVLERTDADIDPFFIQDLFSQSFQFLSPNRRPKVLFITEEKIRTASGKARRWYFKRFFKEERTQRFLGQLILKQQTKT